MYVYIENNQIAEGPLYDLPSSWRNVSGLNMADPITLRNLGWLPYSEEPEPAYDPAVEMIERTVEIGETEVVLHLTVRAMTTAEQAEYAALQVAIFGVQKQSVRDSLAARRYVAEVSGTTYGGMNIETDETTQGKILGAVVAAMLDPAYTVLWKLSDDTFVTLDAAQITAIAQAVRMHVQSCFDHEAALSALIDAATSMTDLYSVDIEAGWPA